MFVAILANDKSRVTSIDPAWDDRVVSLRDLARSGALVCPGCRQQVWLRTGKIRRRHFAHRTLSDCPLEHQSAEVLEVKAQLYFFLRRKFPDAVALDKAIGIPGLDKTVDLLIKTDSGAKFAYWVFDREQRNREVFSPYRSLSGVFAHFIHTGSTLRTATENGIRLTASQREFVCCSHFDAAIAWKGAGHLHFYQVETSTLLIHRGLHCVHRPNLYRSEALRQGSLDSALISPKTGEIVFPEDEEARRIFRQKSCVTPEVLVPKKNEGKAAPDQGLSNEGGVWGVAESPLQSLNLNGPFRCEDCGKETTDWSSATPSAGTCLCKLCSRKRWERKKASTS